MIYKIFFHFSIFQKVHHESFWSLRHKRKHTSEKLLLKYYKQEGLSWICQVEEEERICETKLKGASDTTTGNIFLEMKLISSTYTEKVDNFKIF